MELTIKGRNTEITDDVKQYVQKKLERVGRHLPFRDVETVVELFQKQSKRQDQRSVVEITMTANGAVLRCEEKAADFPAAIDTAADSLDRQIERFKGRLYDRHRAGAAERAGVGRGMLGPAAAAETVSAVIRRKRFLVEAMDEEEAVERMELVGHDFFVFLNAGTGRLGIVYRRKDAGYGLLDPHLP
ncbi:MAG: ribosome-associated translation inhibitor RaiA [Chloroflexi bacterium]|nr:ribosome-associated translation inhibitor RaiA [Chloroflexota bacterium]